MAMRAGGADNKAIILAACIKLFGAGVVPNQVNVLEVVRTEGSSPSVVTVRKGIETFWGTIRDKVGSLPAVLAEGVPEPILEVLKAVAPQLALAAEKVGQAWYQDNVTTLEARTQAAEDAAAGFQLVAKDAQTLLDTVNSELAAALEKNDVLSNENIAARSQIGSLEDGVDELNGRNHELLSKLTNQGEKVERLESELKADRRNLSTLRTEHAATGKALAETREALAVTRAHLIDASAAREALAEASAKALAERDRAHEKVVSDMNARFDQQIHQMGVDLAAAKQALAQSETLKQQALVKNGELAGEIKSKDAEIARCIKAVREAQDELAKERVTRANSFASVERLIEWIKEGDRKPAGKAFTAGPERRVAIAIEGFLAGAK